jgi:uncharacterized membrane protein YkvA (DUF1232 family)
MLVRLRQLAQSLKQQTMVLYLAYRDPRTPWYAKVFAALVVAYALSPIDLIPDFIPFFGYLDDLLIIPLGIYLAIKLIPQEVIDKARFDAQTSSTVWKEKSRLGLVIILILWLIGILFLGWISYKIFHQLTG